MLPPWVVREGAPMEHLSDLEIVTGIIGDLDIAKELLLTAGGLRKLRKMSAEEMLNVSGMGPARVRQLTMSFALASRLATMLPEESEAILSSRSVATLFMEQLRYEKKEHFIVLLLNVKNRIISKEEISVGSLNECVVHPREIFSVAIRKNAARIVLVHNHPSGDPTPSQGDHALTVRIVRAGELLGIPVIDHVIIGDGCSVSFGDRGLLGYMNNDDLTTNERW